MKNHDNQKPELENLLEDLRHPNPNINYQACNDLIKFWPVESIDILIQNLHQNDVFLRRKSVKALGQFGLEALNPIINLFNSNDDKAIKINCLKIFVRLAKEIDPNNIPTELINVIQYSIRDEDPQVILELVSLLRQLKQGGVEFLKNLAKDKNVLRSKAAVTALLEIQEPSIERFLKELLADKSTDELIRNSVIDILDISEDLNN